jgi:magnesium transporter
MADDSPPEELSPLIAALAPAAAAQVLAFCTPRRAAAALLALDAQSLRRVNAAVGPQRLSWMLMALAPDERSSVSARLPEEDRRAVEQLVHYGNDLAGGVAEPRVACVHEDATVGHSLDVLLIDAAAAHYYVYVVGDEQRLVGVASLRSLLLASRDARIIDVMAHRPMKVLAHASRAAIAAHPGWSRFPALPVVTAEGRLVGVIRYARYREIVDGLAAVEHSSEQAERTASALAEVYVVGTSGLAQWAGAVLTREGPNDD